MNVPADVAHELVQMLLSHAPAELIAEFAARLRLALRLAP